MVLSTRSKLVQWTYFLSDWPPSRTSLCAFFWRCFVWMPLFWALVVGLVAVGVGALGLLTYQTRGADVAVAALVSLVVWKHRPLKLRLIRVSNRIERRVERSVFVQGVKAVKGRLCPIIWIEDAE